MSLLSKIFGKKKKEFLPANPHDDDKAAKVYDGEEKNVPLLHYQIVMLPKGFTPTKFFTKNSVLDNKMSSFIPRTKYNEPKAITTKQKRQALTLV